MSNNLRQTLINELSELSLSLSDGLERISEFDLDEEPDPADSSSGTSAVSGENSSYQSSNQKS